MPACDPPAPTDAAESALVQAEPVRTNPCGSDIAPPDVSLTWAEIDLAQVSRLERRRLVLVAHNSAREPLRVVPSVLVEAAPPAEVEAALPEFTIGVGQEVRVEFDLDRIAALADHPTSRAVQPKVEVFAGDRRIETTYAPPLFFHLNRGVMLAYGEEVMRTDFAAGAVDRRVLATLDPSARIRRVQVWSAQ